MYPSPQRDIWALPLPCRRGLLLEAVFSPLGVRWTLEHGLDCTGTLVVGFSSK